MSLRSKSQRAADARYETKRRGRPIVIWRMTPGQARWLKQRQNLDESRADAVARLLGVSDV